MNYPVKKQDELKITTHSRDYRRMIINDNGWYQPGVDWGGKLTVIEKTDNLLWLKIGGCNSHCGRGDTQYYNPSYLIIPVEKTSDNEYLPIGDYIEITYSKKLMKQAKIKAKEIFTANCSRGLE